MLFILLAFVKHAFLFIINILNECYFFSYRVVNCIITSCWTQVPWGFSTETRVLRGSSCCEDHRNDEINQFRCKFLFFVFSMDLRHNVYNSFLSHFQRNAYLMHFSISCCRMLQLSRFWVLWMGFWMKVLIERMGRYLM